MKNLKKIFSLVLALSMLLSIGVSAREINWDDTQTFSAVASSDTVKAGEEFTVSIYLKEDTYSDEPIDLLGGFGMTYTLNWDSAVLSVSSVTHNFGVKSTDMVSSAGEYKYIAESDSDTSIANNSAISVYTFKVADGAAEGDYTITFNPDATSVGEFGGDNYGACYDFTHVDATITVAGDEPEEEVFEITSTGTALDANDTMKDIDGKDVVAAGDKVIAIFAKNVSDAEIAAGSYGIVFGGVRYAGQAAVPAKTAWAIKLVGSADQLPAGSYSYSIFSGDAVVEATAPWVID